MNFSSIYSNVKRYLPVSLVTSLVGGSLFGLVVSGIVFVLNKQVHNPTEVAVLAYGIYFGYGFFGVIGGGIIAVSTAIFLDFLEIEPSRSKYFSGLAVVLLFFIITVLAFHFFYNQLYYSHLQKLKYRILQGTVILFLLLMPKILSLWERLANRVARLWAQTSHKTSYIVGPFVLYIIAPALISAGFAKFNSSSAYAPLQEIQVQKTNRKVILVGWDGATWYVIDKLFKKGLMPNLKKIVDGGVSGTIKSSLPLTSITLWNSIITGKEINKHGIRDYTSTYIPFTDLTLEELTIPQKLGLDKIFKRLNLEVQLISSNRRKVPALWDILSVAGYTVGSIGWWATFPVNRVNGFMVSDQFADRQWARGRLSEKQKSAYIYPGDYYDKLIKDTYTIRDLKRSDISPFMKLNKEDETLLFIEGECNLNLPLYRFAYGMLTDKGQSVIADKMYRKFKPDFFALYFGGLDPTQHIYWGYMEPNLFEWVEEAEIRRYRNVVPQYYQLLDKQLGNLMEIMDEDTVIMVVSDHGLLVAPARKKNEGKHSLYGIFTCYGKGITKKEHIRTTIYDIVPTVLKIMGLPLADDMKGRPIPELFPGEYEHAVLGRRVVTYDFLMNSIYRDKSWDQIVSQAADKRLKAMGYLYR